MDFQSKKKHKELPLKLPADLVGYPLDIESARLTKYLYKELNLHYCWLNFLKENRVKLHTFIDIGAYIGVVSLILSKEFLNIHAFEPRKKTFELLKINLQGIKTVRLYDVALGSKKGEMTISSGYGYMSGSSLNHQSNCISTENISVEPLDNFFHNFNANGLVIKIDVESFEIEVLKGASKLISTAKPIFIMEILKRTIVNGSSESFEFLKQLGYEFYNPQLKYKGNRFFRYITGNKYQIVTVRRLERNHGLYQCLICMPPSDKN